MKEFIFTNFNLNSLNPNFHEIEADQDEDPLEFLENLEQRLLERKQFYIVCDNLPEVQLEHLEEIFQKHNYSVSTLYLNDSISLFLRLLKFNPKTTMLMEVMKNYFYCKLKIKALKFPIFKVQDLSFLKKIKFNFRESLKKEYEYAVDKLEDNYIDDYIFGFEECMNFIDYNNLNFKNYKLRAR